ncbi:hypothetical protein D9758_002634 [Tetrapyrgos nigripes]|uniref:Uncharacterized protein n=1 Tax=Tetrapyrgos nigripes TaxID=182062 RepID=A0A8H5LTB1_9AGAR|nr:hypothetical protein D9758_002634 [Tetrapyrgos nigripes]
MASQSSTSTSSSETSAPSSPGNNQQQSPPNQGNLYLFTFLATLLVLLLISCSIVFRSFVLRRRYRRRLQEALASGGVLAPRTQGSHRKRFRTRPRFFDVWLNEGGDTWEDTMPVAACAIKPKRRFNATSDKVPQSPSQAVGVAQPQTARARLTSLTRGLFQPNHSSASSRLNVDFEPSSPLSPTSPTTPITPYSPFEEKPDPLGTTTSLLQVSVLVAMPSPRRYTSAPSEEIPEVCFGVTRLPCKIPAVMGSGQSS